MTPSSAGRVGIATRWLPPLFGIALFGLALSLRLWGLTQSVTADDQDWIQRAIDFGQALEQRKFRDTYQSAHPGVPILWVASAVMSPRQRAELERVESDQTLMEQSPAYLQALFSIRRALAAYASLLTVVVALLAWRLFGAGPGVLAGLLLAAEPFLVAHGQLFSTDTMLALLMTVSVLAAFVYFDGRGDRFFLIGSGLAAGLAFSTKAPAIILFAVVPLAGLGWLVAERRASYAQVVRLLLDVALWGLAAGLLYLAIWPALWGDPIGTMLRLEREVRGVGESPRRWGNFFLGQIYPDDDVALLLRPIFYPVVTALRLSPITFVGILACAALAVAWRRSTTRGERDRRRIDVSTVALAAYAVLFVAMMTISPKKLDRYILPVFPPLVILAAIGLWWTMRRWLLTQWRWVAVVALGFGQVGLVALVEPYPLSFYNPLLGGATVARQAMIVGWGEGLDQVARYLNQQPDADQTVAVSLYKDQLVPLLRGSGARLEDWRKGTVLVSYVNMEQRGLIPAQLQELVATTPPDFAVWINGIAYARVFRIPPEIREQADPGSGIRRNDVPHP